jgi:hypothetical protein
LSSSLLLLLLLLQGRIVLVGARIDIVLTRTELRLSFFSKDLHRNALQIKELKKPSHRTAVEGGCVCFFGHPV